MITSSSVLRLLSENTMTLKEQLLKDSQDSMRSGDEMRKQTLRMLRSAIRSTEMARSSYILDLAGLDESALRSQAVGQTEVALVSEVRRRRQLAQEYDDADNLEMAAKERDEIGVLVQKYAELDDRGVEDVIRKEIKQRRESADTYERAKRMDLADKERAEATILEAYLPQQMTEEEVEAEVRAILAETDAREMSKIMPAAMSRMKGRAEGRLVNRVVTRVLAEG
jgi:uncharacterized protein